MLTPESNPTASGWGTRKETPNTWATRPVQTRHTPIVCIGLVALVLVLISSCTSTTAEYTVIQVDTTWFVDHNVLGFRSQDDSLYVVITPKPQTLGSATDLRSREPLEIGGIYALSFMRADTLPRLTFALRGYEQSASYYVYDELDSSPGAARWLFWKNGEYQREVYICNDISDVYVSAKRRIGNK